MTHRIIMPVVLGQQMTKRCLNSCWAQDLIQGVEVIAIDNASTDGVGQWLRAEARVRRNLTVHSHHERVSLNRIWNDCLRYVFNILMCDHVLVINNDIVMRPDTYRLLIEDGGLFVTGVSTSDEAGIIGCDPLSKSPHPSFSCFLMRRRVWDQVGRFDEDYHVYCSDADYHLRMDKKGIDAYALAVPFLHEVSGTIKHATNSERDRIQAHADADRATFERKYGFAVGSPEYYASFRHSRENKYQRTGRLDG